MRRERDKKKHEKKQRGREGGEVGVEMGRFDMWGGKKLMESALINHVNV